MLIEKLLEQARENIELAELRLINNEDKETVTEALEEAMTSIDGIESTLRIKGLID